MNTISGLGPSFADQAVLGGAAGDSSALSPEVGKKEFLQLLVTQLKNQNPMDPINNEQFIAQLATFSSLEQLISINSAVTKLAEYCE